MNSWKSRSQQLAQIYSLSVLCFFSTPFNYTFYFFCWYYGPIIGSSISGRVAYCFKLNTKSKFFLSVSQNLKTFFKKVLNNPDYGVYKWIILSRASLPVEFSFIVFNKCQKSESHDFSGFRSSKAEIGKIFQEKFFSIGKIFQFFGKIFQKNLWVGKLLFF